jgi:ADP-ribosyl-[dinitrogen reductase] hydrolase
MIMEKMIIGAVAGNMIGMCHNAGQSHPANMPLIKENLDYGCDTVLTVAVMDALLNGREYTETLQAYGRNYPDRGYGTALVRWMKQDRPQPFHSWNNGAALRISPVGHACRTLDETLNEARMCAGVSHNHPDGIKGAQAAAACVFLAKNGRTKEEIRDYVESAFRYDLNRRIEDIRRVYYYDQSCEGSVPEAIIAFLESTGYEDSLRLAISLGKSNGSLPCITGAISQAYYKEMPQDIIQPVISRLSPEIIEVIEKFSNTYPLSLFH